MTVTDLILFIGMPLSYGLLAALILIVRDRLRLRKALRPTATSTNAEPGGHAGSPPPIPPP